MQGPDSSRRTEHRPLHPAPPGPEARASATRSQWIIAAALFVWALAGIAIYVGYFVEAPEQYAQGVEDATHRSAYAEYVKNIPWWAIGAGIVAAVARFLGALALFRRRACAVPLYRISLAFFLVALFRAFVLAHVWEVMSAGHMAIEALFLLLSGFAVEYSARQRSAGILT